MHDVHNTEKRTMRSIARNGLGVLNARLGLLSPAVGARGTATIGAVLLVAGAGLPWLSPAVDSEAIITPRGLAQTGLLQGTGVATLLLGVLALLTVLVRGWDDRSAVTSLVIGALALFLAYTKVEFYENNTTVLLEPGSGIDVTLAGGGLLVLAAIGWALVRLARPTGWDATDLSAPFLLGIGAFVYLVAEAFQLTPCLTYTIAETCEGYRGMWRFEPEYHRLAVMMLGVLAVIKRWSVRTAYLFTLLGSLVLTYAFLHTLSPVLLSPSLRELVMPATTFGMPVAGPSPWTVHSTRLSLLGLTVFLGGAVLYTLRHRWRARSGIVLWTGGGVFVAGLAYRFVHHVRGWRVVDTESLVLLTLTFVRPDTVLLGAFGSVLLLLGLRVYTGVEHTEKW